jgi:hypothetical protein
MSFSVEDLRHVVKKIKDLNEEENHYSDILDEILVDISKQGLAKVIWSYNINKMMSSADAVIVYSEDKEFMENLSFQLLPENHKSDNNKTFHDSEGRLLETPADLKMCMWEPGNGKLMINTGIKNIVIGE